MFKITITNKSGQTETANLSEHIHDIYQKFRENGIETSPFQFTIKEARSDASPVRIHSDSDFGNAALKLLKGNETIYDAYILEQGLANTRDELKDEIEQNIFYEQHGDTVELFDDVRRMTIGLASEKLSFFCPLKGNMRDNEDGYYYETDNYTLLSNTIWTTMMTWMYDSVYSAVADFFTMMGNMGAEIFELKWVQATVYLLYCTNQRKDQSPR